MIEQGARSAYRRLVGDAPEVPATKQWRGTGAGWGSETGWCEEFQNSQREFWNYHSRYWSHAQTSAWSPRRARCRAFNLEFRKFDIRQRPGAVQRGAPEQFCLYVSPRALPRRKLFKSLSSWTPPGPSDRGEWPVLNSVSGLFCQWRRNVSLAFSIRRMLLKSSAAAPSNETRIAQAPVAERPIALPPRNQGADALCHCYSNHCYSNHHHRALSAAPRLS